MWKPRGGQRDGQLWAEGDTGETMAVDQGIDKDGKELVPQLLVGESVEVEPDD